jgi:hypothetical protein
VEHLVAMGATSSSSRRVTIERANQDIGVIKVPLRVTGHSFLDSQQMFPIYTICR